MARKKTDYTRVNITGLPEEIGRAFVELCKAKEKQVSDIFIELVEAGCESNKMILEADREKKEADAKLEALRQ